MKVKVLSPITGEIQSTSSTGKFNSAGMAFSVKENLVAGEEEKFQKLLAKYGKGGTPVAPKTPQAPKELPEESKEQEVVVKVPEKKIAEAPVKPVVQKKVQPLIPTGGGIKGKGKKVKKLPAINPEVPVEEEGIGWWY